ncbi:ABC transporter permease [bacterium]|jgi:ABC-type transport system involved in multi-copper enzyme maturation permease subunit|nr:ABC transporter permease [bacterium]
MHRLITLILFELNKILSRKKALLFLFALNVIPLIAAIGLLIAYVKFNSLGYGQLSYSMLYEAVKNLFTIHFKLFSLISPFFLALIVGDSFSTEFGRGYMKMLLLTPVKRWQVISAKTVAVMIFLVIAVLIGGFLLQCDLYIAKALTKSDIGEMANAGAIVSAGSAFQLLLLSLVGNLMTTGYFIVFSLFFESAIMMAFTALTVLMMIHAFYFIVQNLFIHIDPWYSKLAEWCFTRHSDTLFSFGTISGILDKTKTIMTEEIMQSAMASLAWAALFFAVALFIFSKKQILH